MLMLRSLHFLGILEAILLSHAKFQHYQSIISIDQLIKFSVSKLFAYIS